MRYRRFLRLSCAAAVCLLAACKGANVQENPADAAADPNYNRGFQSTLDDSGGVLFSTAKSNSKEGRDSGGGALGVNAYLWRGALDTLSFMPLASADPFGGVIITDWYSPAAASGERFKATAYILGRQLRADGVRVSLFRQVQQGGQWVDAPVSPSTTSEVEDKVLARARELRAQNASN
jgi:hypothetical protein